ncbi:MAG: hypothetical protein AAF725_18560 [Acidobacteriota bacterium]
MQAALVLLVGVLFALPAFGDWGEDALALQEFLDTKNTFNKTIWVGAHNAYANDEWGYFDPNQTLRPGNLLKAGARQMEYDPRKDISGDLRLCHGTCGADDKTLIDGLDQIKNFVKDNKNAVVFLKLEMKEAYSKTADKLENHLGDWIYRPTEGRLDPTGCTGRYGLEPEFLTKADILAAGKNVIVFAGNGAMSSCPGSSKFLSWVHVGVEYQSSGWQKSLNKSSSPSDAGAKYGQGIMTLVHDPNTFSGPNGGFEDQIFTSNNVDNYMNQGHNVFELFNFNGKNALLYDEVDARHMVWSWNNNEPSGNGSCAQVNKPVDTGFDDIPCDLSLRFACYNKVSDDWNVTSGSGIWEEGRQTCISEFGDSYDFAAPTNGRQMNDLLNTADAGNVSTGIYVNYHSQSLSGVWQVNDMNKLSLSRSPAYGYPTKGSRFDHRYLVERGLLTSDLQRITSVRLQGKSRVKAIEVTYAGGLTYTQGDSDGSYTSALNLSGSNRLSSVEYCLDRVSGDNRIVHLELTNTSGSTISYGPKDGTCSTVTFDRELYSIYGTWGDGALKSLGFDTGSAELLGQDEGFEIKAAYNTSKCMYKQNSGWSNGNRLVLGDCGSDSSGGNRWTYEASTGLIRAVQDPSKCIHKKDANWNNGNVIHVWNCSSDPSGLNKTWDFNPSNGRISARGNSGKCIHKKFGNNWDNGNPIHLWNCGSGAEANKSWDLD